MASSSALRSILETGVFSRVRPLIEPKNIWYGYHTGLGENVVLKGVRPHYADSALRAEEQLARDIASHPRNRNGLSESQPTPGIIRSYGILETGSGPYFMMPRRLPLSAYIDGSAGSVELLQFLARGSDALAAVHRAGFYYNDVKPPNFVLQSCREADVQVIDFGDVSKRLPLEFIGSTGTIGFISPQQLEGICDPRGDVFGLGASAYALITGSCVTQMLPPSIASRSVKLAIAQSYRNTPKVLPRELSAQFADLPGSTRTLIDAMIAPKSGDRPSLREVGDGAREALRQIGAHTD